MDSAGILQSYLDEVSAATLRLDWEAYREAVALPCAVISHDESKVITSEDELKAGFDTFAGTLKALRVTDYIRLVEQASLLDHDLISGSYISHLIAGGQRVLAPYRSIMTLRLVGNRWKAASVTNGLANSRWPLIRRELPEEK